MNFQLYNFYVYILPLRNENLTNYCQRIPAYRRLYPTFKEWKPVLQPANTATWQRLYPTFKEWKLTLKQIEKQEKRSLYPTFKEWKPLLENKNDELTKRVYILPLRNENQI